MMVARANGRGLWITRADANEDGGGLMMIAWASDCGLWLGGCTADMLSGASAVDGAGEVEVGHNGLTGKQKAPVAGRAKMGAVGPYSLIVRLCVCFVRKNHAVDGSSEVEVGTLMVMVSPLEMGHLEPIRTTEMGDLVPIGGHGR